MIQNRAKIIRTINASSPMLTRIAVKALIDIDSAESSSEASALADRPRDSFFAKPTVLAGIGITILSIVATFPTQFFWTFTVKIIAEIDTICSMQTRIWGTRILRVSRKNVKTVTSKHRCKATFLSDFIRHKNYLIVFAISASEPWWTSAGVATFVSILSACCSIETRLSTTNPWNRLKLVISKLSYI